MQTPQPQAFGHVDPDFAGLPGRPGLYALGVQRPVVAVQVVQEAPPNPVPRKCVYILLMLSCLMVLRMQQERYTDRMQWHTGSVPDKGDPFPWQGQTLVRGNDTFEAMLLAPLIRRSSAFVRTSPADSKEGEPAMTLTGLTKQFMFSGSAGADGTATLEDAASNVSAVSGAFTELHRLSCGALVSNSGTQSGVSGPSDTAEQKPCFMGTQKLPSAPAPGSIDVRAIARHLGDGSCHRFLAGDSPASLRPLVTSASQDDVADVVCVRASRIHSVVPTIPVLESTSATLAHAIIAWDPILPGRSPASSGESWDVDGISGHDKSTWALMPSRWHGGIAGLTCLALVALDSAGKLQIGRHMVTDHASVVMTDGASRSLITIGYTASQVMLINQLDESTLTPRWTYRLPLKVAWLLRVPRLANGYLNLVGAEDPFTGTIFTIDLVHAEVYEQPPPSADSRGRTPERRKLPKALAVERLVNKKSSQSASASEDQGLDPGKRTGICGLQVASDPGPAGKLR
eukprot:TRINITY_DN35830_c0_g1_i1.p1 TRINITY_DN35830_c0_g1~~TRINITY_DN35830_c0_g1_i1.p1  ORF type:complete len:514 (+),score=58.56 TRINITY_DN35830_c0_g1_i1:191-1732(+)